MEEINKLRKLAAVTREMFSALVENTLKRMANTYSTVIYLQEKMKVLLKDKDKETLAAVVAEEAKTEEKTEEVVASEGAVEDSKEEVIDEAIDNAEVEDSAVAATTDAQVATVYEKYKDAFNIEHFDIKNK